MKYCTTLLMVLLWSMSLLHAEETQSPAVNNLLGKEVSAKAGWKAFIHPTYKQADASVAFKDNNIIIQTVNASKLEEPLSYGQQVYNSMELEAGKTYQFSFSTKSDVEGKIYVKYILAKAPYSNYASVPVTLKTDKIQKHVIKFTPKPVKDVYDTPRSLRFFTGSLSNGQITISDLVLTEVTE
ncbi:MAG TPA: hypothetical protein DCM28_21975 [Phycisphaerales bacterium]|nr:hypothetical protein [Phycisphaerales bacterium]HCD31254.1 hypothetical protein [Phycisphaerales bacterium]|tara:strand:- start:86 stop:634 length:549 start_codon:yes stop_codon:yes gene_type:complete